LKVSLLFLALWISTASASPSSGIAAGTTRPEAPSKPWYASPKTYYLVGGALFLSGVAVTFQTDDCEQPPDARCRTQNTIGQSLGFPGMALIGIGLWLQFWGPDKNLDGEIANPQARISGMIVGN
jgi:hypothetical protein